MTEYAFRLKFNNLGISLPNSPSEPIHPDGLPNTKPELARNRGPCQSLSRPNVPNNQDNGTRFV